MAQKVSIILTDDIDGSEASETVSFGLDGSQYEIDLNDKNAKALRKALDQYVSAGRKVSTGRKRSTSTKSTEDLAAIREWAKANGYEVSDRGRVKQHIKDAYYAAN